MEGERVLEILVSRGMRPRAQWLAACLGEMAAPPHLPPESRAERCFAQLLVADFNLIAEGVLPPDLHSMHKVELPGPFVLQVDEVVDISSGLRDRYREKNAGIGNRCLKLSLTDGAQRVFGIEYRPIPQLKVLQPAGSKICVTNVCIRRGLLLLVPEIVVVLGGVVEELEEARERVVEQVNKPPRGNRYPRGTSPPSLEQQLSQAAWPRTPDAQENNPAAANRGNEPSTARSSADEFSYQSAEQTRHQQTRREESFEASSDTPASRIRTLSLQSTRESSSSSSQFPAADPNLPFTYLAVLEMRFSETGSVQSGRIKCILTSVKEFHFRDRDEFRLTVHIEDGSLLTDAVVVHQLVERMIGHTPAEVTAALSLSSSDHGRMKSKMRELQAFLKRYQGYMDIEFGDTVRVVAMFDCPLDAEEMWSLAARVENYTRV